LAQKFYVQLIFQSLSIKTNIQVLLLNNEQLNDIATDLEMGMVCYLHKKTGKKIAIIDWENDFSGDTELWAKDIKEIKKHPEKYYKINGMDTHDSFEIMRDFMDTVQYDPLKEKLRDAIDKRKPFRQFKNVIDNSDERENWFSFKTQKYIEWVKEQIKTFNDTELHQHFPNGEKTQDDDQSPMGRKSVNPQIFSPYTNKNVQFYDLVEIEDWKTKVYTLSEKKNHPFMDMVEAAIAELPDWLTEIPLPPFPPIAILIVHESNEYNLASLNWWFDAHTLHQRSYLSSNNNPTNFLLSPDFKSIWDMSVLWHERNAWIKHILQQSNKPNFDVYLADTLEGEV